MKTTLKIVVFAAFTFTTFEGCMNMPTPSSQITGSYTSELRKVDNTEDLMADKQESSNNQISVFKNYDYDGVNKTDKVEETKNTNPASAAAKVNTDGSYKVDNFENGVTDKQVSSNNQTKPNNKSEGSFTFPCQDGINIEAHYMELKEWEKFGRNQYLVTFKPYLKRTDGNMYTATLFSVINIFQEYYGQGGLFYLDTAEIKQDELLKNNVVYWKLPTGKGLYMMHMRENSKNDSAVGALIIYLK